MFGRKKLSYDESSMTPVIKCSICTGEQVAGFKDIKTGKFFDVMVIRNTSDLEEFKKLYGITSVSKEY